MSQEDVSIIKKYKKKIEKLKEHNKLYYTKDSPKISNAEYDPIDWEKFGVELLSEIGTKFNWVPRYKQMRGHNHVSQVYSIGSGDNGVGPDIVDFIDQTLNS